MAGISGRGVVGSAVYIASNGQLGILSSSKRFKKNIRSLDSHHSNILDLRPVTFRYKEADAEGGHPLQYGLIAEEVAEIFPDLVEYDGNGEPATVYYHLLTPLLLAALQQEHKSSEQQRVAMRLLHKQNEDFRAEMMAFREQIRRQAAEIAMISTRQDNSRVVSQRSSY